MPNENERSVCGPCNPCTPLNRKKAVVIASTLAGVGLAGLFTMAKTNTFPLKTVTSDTHSHNEQLGLSAAFILSLGTAGISLTYLAMRVGYLLFSGGNHTLEEANETAPLLINQQPSTTGFSRIRGFLSQCMGKKPPTNLDTAEAQLNYPPNNQHL